MGERLNLNEVYINLHIKLICCTSSENNSATALYIGAGTGGNSFFIRDCSASGNVASTLYVPYIF